MLLFLVCGTHKEESSFKNFQDQWSHTSSKEPLHTYGATEGPSWFGVLWWLSQEPSKSLLLGSREETAGVAPGYGVWPRASPDLPSPHSPGRCGSGPGSQTSWAPTLAQPPAAGKYHELKQLQRGQFKKAVLNEGLSRPARPLGAWVPTPLYFSSAFSEVWDCFFCGKSWSIRLNTCAIS